MNEAGNRECRTLDELIAQLPCSCAACGCPCFPASQTYCRYRYIGADAHLHRLVLRVSRCAAWQACAPPLPMCLLGSMCEMLTSMLYNAPALANCQEHSVLGHPAAAAAPVPAAIQPPSPLPLPPPLPSPPAPVANSALTPVSGRLPCELTSDMEASGGSGRKQGQWLCKTVLPQMVTPPSCPLYNLNV